MVSRAHSKPRLHRRRSPRAARRWFAWWRLLLTRAFTALSALNRKIARALRVAAVGARELVTSHALADIRHPALGWFGAISVLAGGTIGILLATPGIDRRSAALAGAASMLWAGVRWLLMRLALPRRRAGDPPVLRGALSLGLLAYAFAVTPELRLLAWLASGMITAIVLLRLDRQRGEVVRAVGIAWGAQALVVAGGVIARIAIVATVSARG